MKKQAVHECITTIDKNSIFFRKIMRGQEKFDIEKIIMMQEENIECLNIIVKQILKSKILLEKIYPTLTFSDVLKTALFTSLYSVDLRDSFWTRILLEAATRKMDDYQDLIYTIPDVHDLYVKEGKNINGSWSYSVCLMLLGIIMDSATNSSTPSEMIEKVSIFLSQEKGYKIEKIIPILFLVLFSVDEVIAKKFGLSDNLDLIHKFYFRMFDKIKSLNLSVDSDFSYYLLDQFAAILVREDDQFSDFSAHYTSKENFEKIISTKSLKFSKPQFVNDEDEGKVLTNRKSDVSFLSLTSKIDSLDLWGNYTNFDGICLVFDKVILAILSKITAEKGNSWISISVDGGRIVYNSNKVALFEKEMKNVCEKIKCTFINSDNAINVAISDVEDLWTWLFKKQPWAYEQEERFVITDKKIKIIKNWDANWKNFKISDDHLFVNFPTSSLKKIIISPELKKSSIFMKGLKAFLTQHGFDDVEITLSEANIKNFRK